MKFGLMLLLIVGASVLATVGVLWVSALNYVEFVAALPTLSAAWLVLLLFMAGGYWGNTRFPPQRNR